MDQTSMNMFMLSNLRIENNLPEIFVITSGKGGVGKTNVSVNLALLLRQLKKKVLLVDADIHLGNVDLILGLRPKHTIEDVISGEMSMKDVIISGPGGIDILPASSAVLTLLDLEDEVLKRLGDAFSKFEHNYDTVVVDTGAGISRNVMSFVLGADKVIIVVTPDPSSIADAYGVIKVTKQTTSSLPILMIANMVANYDEGESLYKKMNLMVKRFLGSSISFGGIILRDELVSDCVKMQRSLVIEYPNSRPVHALKLITRNVLNMPTTDVSKRTGFFDRLLSNRDTTIGKE